ncbi:hypothetical protein Aperf_G00000070179 [Anoplocephala perfoliata]
MSAPECPLCMESLDNDDICFYPCPCLYQVCRFCWTKILNELNGECPACRKKYDPEAVIVLPRPSSPEFKRKPNKRKKEIVNIKQIPKETLARLPELRVIQTNLVFAIGLPFWIAKEKDKLKEQQYFGQFGTVYKVEVNANQTFPGPQGQTSVSAYVTYERAEDAMRAVLTLDQSTMHGRQLRVSLGTTKYCSQFLRGNKCAKPDCMYLHALGDPEASFTKEEMHAGKHTDYMKMILTKFKEEHPFNVNSSVGENNSNSAVPSTSTTHDTGGASSSYTRQSSGSPPSGRSTSGPSRRTISANEPLQSVGREVHKRIALSAVEPPPSSSSSSNNNANKACSFSQISSKSPSSYDRSLDLFYPQQKQQQQQQPPTHIPDRPQFVLDNNHSNGVNLSAFADIGFDPIQESQAGLAELLASEQPAPPRPPMPQLSIATQTFYPGYAMMCPPPPGFENTPAPRPEEVVAMTVTANNRNPYALAGITYETLLAMAAKMLQPQQSQQQQHHHRLQHQQSNPLTRQQWQSTQEGLDLISAVLRRPMSVNGGPNSQSLQPSNSNNAASGFVAQPSSSVTALNVSCLSK